MSIDAQTVKHVARLARIAISEDEVEPLGSELNLILGWVEQLAEVDVEGVEPMTSVQPLAMKMREDHVTDGAYPEYIVDNAPASQESLFLVPKVIE